MEEFQHRKINFSTEVMIPIKYKERTLTVDFRCDLYVENCLVVALKSVKELNAVFEAQLLTYVKLLEAAKGILINFNCSNIFNDGQKTYVNEFFRKLKP
ncbi:MAG TPA: GxxExxY protein [Bacteroidia bacterium]|nr:GxxExxY protein [Bacteroidia bacterium]